MSKVHSNIILLIACVSGLEAQTNRPYQGNPALPPSGEVVMTPHVSEPVVSLDQLVKMSQLIVDADVATVLTPIVRNPLVAGEVETDSVVTIRRVLRGKAPATSQLVLIEDGGVQGQWRILISGNPPVTKGERYLFFLAADPRITVPNSSAILPDRAHVPRYFPLGVGDGKAQVDSKGQIQFPPGTVGQLAKFNGSSLDAFEKTLGDIIQRLSPVYPPYPSGVTPLTPPSNTLLPGSPKK